MSAYPYLSEAALAEAVIAGFEREGKPSASAGKSLGKNFSIDELVESLKEIFGNMSPVDLLRALARDWKGITLSDLFLALKKGFPDLTLDGQMDQIKEAFDRCKIEDLARGARDAFSTGVVDLAKALKKSYAELTEITLLAVIKSAYSDTMPSCRELLLALNATFWLWDIKEPVGAIMKVIPWMKHSDLARGIKEAFRNVEDEEIMELLKKFFPHVDPVDLGKSLDMARFPEYMYPVKKARTRTPN
jgi:hypothetical protein